MVLAHWKSPGHVPGLCIAAVQAQNQDGSLCENRTGADKCVQAEKVKSAGPWKWPGSDRPIIITSFNVADGKLCPGILGRIRKLRVFVAASPTLVGSCLLSLLGDGGGAGGRWQLNLTWSRMAQRGQNSSLQGMITG